MKNFGTGTVWAAQTMDALGNAIAVPTPIKFGILQDVGLDFSRDIKELYGQLGMPIAVGGGKMKIDCKVKFAEFNGRLFNDLFFGQGTTAGTMTAASEDLVGVAIPSTPFTIAVTPPNSGTFSRDLGVRDSNGVAFKRVSSAPATGQYSLTGSTYTFAAADTGRIVYISYAYTYTLAGAQSVTLNNVQMGNVPIFGMDLAMPYQGKNLYLRLPSCAAKKLTFNPKQDDFTELDMDISVFADSSTNSIGSIVTYE